MARKALEQVQGVAAGRDFETVDLDRLEPHTSAYSSQAGRAGVGTSVDNDTGGSRTGLTATGGGRVREEDDVGQSRNKRLKKVTAFISSVYTRH